MNARNAKGLAPLPGQRPRRQEAGGRRRRGFLSHGHHVRLGRFDVRRQLLALQHRYLGGGDDLDYEYSSTDGTLTGNTIDTPTWIGVWAADGAFNSQTGMMWQVNVGGDNCMYELDPASHTADW